MDKVNGGVANSQQDIEHEIIQFYRKLIGTAAPSTKGVDIEILREGAQISREHGNYLIRPVTDEEIVEALKSLGDNKAPGIDGFNAKFFKNAWSTIGEDVKRAVRFFFTEKKLYPAANCTLVTLIPKTKQARAVKNLRPISCCTTIYKIISKILTARLGAVICTVVNESQSAFIPGRKIDDNIFLAQELMKGYGRQHISPRCMIQVDLQKAYDTVDWNALESILRELGFPMLFVDWVMLGVRTVSYRYVVNGRPSEIIPAKRGVRQGDPISPYLFVLVMEYLHRIISRLRCVPDFNFHPKCEKLGIVNLCFADDLMLLTRGDKISVQMMLGQLKSFSASTGLIANVSKCRMFFGGLNEEMQEELLVLAGMQKGHLPVRYLGVPLDCKRLSIAAYDPLIEKITCRLRHWTTRLLSYAGRLQLIKSVVTSMAMYWLQIFPFPKKVLNYVEGLCRSFLWSSKVEVTKKAPIAWKKVCEPRNSGGLKVLDLNVWNQVMCAKMLWDLATKADKLWVKWIHTYFMKNVEVMDYQVKHSCSWLLKAVLNCRDRVKDSRVWQQLHPGEKLSVRELYKELMVSDSVVSWRKLFFSNYARPRAVFIFWMLCSWRLYTKERLVRFGIPCADIGCCFCDEAESMDHLFFHCRYSKILWKKVLIWLKIEHDPLPWREELSWLERRTKGSKTSQQVLKIAAAETVYYIWRTRNLKIHEKRVEDEAGWKIVCGRVAVCCEHKSELNRFTLAADNRL